MKICKQNSSEFHLNITHACINIRQNFKIKFDYQPFSFISSSVKKVIFTRKCNDHRLQIKT